MTTDALINTVYRPMFEPGFKYGWTVVNQDGPILRTDGAPHRFGNARSAHLVAERSNAGATDGLSDLLAGFRAAHPKLSIWERYPNVHVAEDDWTSFYACNYWPDQFAEYARARGADAVTVHGQQPEEELAGEHRWTRVSGVNVDWTARQFWNLNMGLPLGKGRHSTRELSSLPCPMVWLGEAYPLVEYGRITVDG